ncbi:MAG: type II toxin-antitoxin system HipA family toxin [Gammaproteobacteria bacterium]|nr:type II toxin-antitoxin system HipA family toxin [Gammaproteobacteria bacterium]
MVKKVDTAIVKLWGKTAGAVSWLDDRGYGVFEYDPDFLKSGLDVSPVHMSLDDARKGDGKFTFPALNKDTFLGLPGMLADALPDKFGNAIIDTWLARQGRDSAGFSPVERLCYIGKRGLGALEFSPATIDKYDASVPVEISELVMLAQQIIQERKTLDVRLGGSEKDNAEAIMDILRVGTSAGGARPKAVIAMDANGNVRSGQTAAPPGYDYWIVKFDGVTDLELGEPKGFGRLEYAYHLMARAAGIHMSECRLLEENGRAHFMTKRFDRVNGSKLHLQSLCGIAHFDFNQSGVYSYEQAFTIMRKLRLSKADAAEQYRRMVFNIMARDLDDHTKNISFLMEPDGKWTLSPAYDVVYSHNPKGKWTNQHQMSINGKRDHFTREDLLYIGESISLPRPQEIIDGVANAVRQWPEFAKTAGLKPEIMSEIKANLRIM